MVSLNDRFARSAYSILSSRVCRSGREISLVPASCNLRQHSRVDEAGERKEGREGRGGAVTVGRSPDNLVARVVLQNVFILIPSRRLICKSHDDNSTEHVDCAGIQFSLFVP